MNIKRTSSGLPPAAAGNDTGNETGKTSGPISGDGIAKADQISRTNRPDGARRAGRTRQAESEDLARLKAAVSGYATRDLNDPARTKEVVAKVARELVESGTQSLPHLTAQQKADLAKFAENDPVISTKILSFVREQVG